MIQTTNLALMQTLYGQNALLVYVYFLFVYCVYILDSFEKANASCYFL